MKRRSFLCSTSIGFGMAGFGMPPVPWSNSILGNGKADDSNVPMEAPLAGSAKGPWRRLFLDGSVVEKEQGLDKVFYSAEKHPANPLIVADRPWEGKSAITGPYVYGTVCIENGTFRLWYQILNEGNHVGYAESNDGIRWRKPELDIIEYEGKKTNLVVSAFQPQVTGGGYCHNPNVVKRPDEPDPSQRYALYGYDSKLSHPSVAYSADGLHWKYATDPKDRNLFTSSDVVNFFYDPYQGRTFSTWKTRNRRGRAVGIASSKDGLHWTKPYDGPVFSADDLDPNATQVYGMPVFPYQGLYIGVPWIYSARYFRYGEYSVEKLHESQEDSPRTMHPELAWSWDLVQWTRPASRSPFIKLGDQSEWDRGMVLTARAPVVVGDKLYFYYGGCDKPHDEKRTQAGIGLATLRVDGFCSMKANQGIGWFITRREPMLGPNLMINGRTEKGGSIRAELLDRKDRVIPGFSKEDSIPFEGDSIASELKWKSPSFEPSQVRKDYKIRFWLERAELFSYIPTQLNPKEPDIARFQMTGP